MHTAACAAPRYAVSRAQAASPITGRLHPGLLLDGARYL